MPRRGTPGTKPVYPWVSTDPRRRSHFSLRVSWFIHVWTISVVEETSFTSSMVGSGLDEGKGRDEALIDSLAPSCNGTAS